MSVYCSGKCRLAVLFFFFAASSALLTAQVSSMEPERPAWGDTITFRYAPNAEGATLTPGEDIYVQVHAEYPGGVEQQFVKMDSEESGERVFRFTLPKPTAFLSAFFHTQDAGDEAALLYSMVFGPDGRGVRGAHAMNVVWVEDSQRMEEFEKEIALYPDHFGAYYYKWRYARGNDRPAIIRKDLADIKARAQAETLDYLSALSAGHIMLGEEPQARAALKKMFRLDPVSGHTLKALIYYEYEVYAQQMEGEGPREVDALVRDVIAAHPQSDLARKKLLPLMAGKTLPISAIEAVADAWIEKEPDNPMPYYILARALFDRGMRLDEADRAMHTSIQLILNGKFIEFGDTSGYRKRTFLPSAYYWSGEIAMARGNKVKALAAAYASQNVASEDDPRAYDLAGRLWEALPGFERAQQAYLRGLSRGSKQAADRLGAIYARKHGQDAGFEQWLDSVRSEGNGADPDRQPAPLFSARDMNGQTVALTELRGKVVVLNFWAVTCAPCRVEMPALNKLAEEYGDRDVVFLAPTGDGSDSVRRFLKKQKFAYRVLPAAGELMVLYGIRGFPVHMVIDKKGRVATRLFGGSKDRHEDLKPYIEAELKAE